MSLIFLLCTTLRLKYKSSFECFIHRNKRIKLSEPEVAKHHRY